MALAYLLSVVVSLVVLAVALRRCPAPAPAPEPDRPAPGPHCLLIDGEPEVHQILAAATQLAHLAHRMGAAA
jgi:hypothetical protein